MNVAVMISCPESWSDFGTGSRVYIFSFENLVYLKQWSLFVQRQSNDACSEVSEKAITMLER